MSVDSGRGTIERMPKSKAKPVERSPSWPVYARLDPDLKGPVEAYQASFTYPPKLAKVIERALRLLIQDDKAQPHNKRDRHAAH